MEKRLKLVSVILPTFNERENIIPIITAILEEFNPAEVIVVDDNSPDGTGDIVQKYSKNISRVRQIQNIPSIGLTQSIQRSIDSAKNEWIVWMDADFTHPPKALNDLYKERNHADIIIGSWLVPGGKDERKQLFTRMYSRIINVLCKLLFNCPATAYTSGFALVKKSLFDDFTLQGDYGEYFIDFVVRNHRRSKKIIEVPIICAPRKAGVSKTAPNLWIFGKRSIKYIYIIIKLFFNCS